MRAAACDLARSVTRLADGRESRQNRASEHGAIVKCAGGTDNRQTKYRHGQDDAAASLGAPSPDAHALDKHEASHRHLSILVDN
jgi:hypothetical protein